MQSELTINEIIEKPRVSIVMPVYNTKEVYLREAIESVLNQTYYDFEFIIVNNASTEPVKNIIDDYPDKRIKYLELKENFGAAHARNYAISQMKGIYYAAMDSDDICCNTRLEKQVKFLDNNDEYNIVCSWFETFPKIKIIKARKCELSGDPM